MGIQTTQTLTKSEAIELIISSDARKLRIYLEELSNSELETLVELRVEDPFTNYEIY